MKMEDIKTITAMFGAVEAFITFIMVLGCTVGAESVSNIEWFMALLIMASGCLMFITYWD